MNSAPFLVNTRKLFDLLLSLAGNKLELLWPDMPRPGKVEHVLPRQINQHGSHLVS